MEGYAGRGRLGRAPARALGCLLAIAAVPGFTAASASAATHIYMVRHGPVTLGAYQTKYPRSAVPAVKHSGYVVGMTARLVDRRGRPISIRRVMLHHVVFVNRGRPHGPRKLGSCMGRGGEPFYGTGEETQRLILPPGYGYEIDRRENWTAVAIYMNHSSKETDVYLQYTVTGETSKKLAPVKPLWLRASGCDPSSSYTVDGVGAAGSADVRSYRGPTTSSAICIR